jgi:hypothetical protein
MIEVEKGIYRLDGELANPNGRPLILVHPWYEERWPNREASFRLWGGSQISGWSDSNKKGYPKLFYDGLARIGGMNLTANYLNNLETLLKNSANQPVIVLEESKISDKTTKRICDVRGSKGLYLVPTQSDEPLPTKTDLDAVRKYVKTLGNEFWFAGGQISIPAFEYEHAEQKWTGCLGVAFEIISQKGREGNVVLGCCFNGSWSNWKDIPFGETLNSGKIPVLSDN